MARVNTTIAPSLPLMQRDYNYNQIEQVHNALRLYFNQLDNFTRTVGGPLGQGYVDSPHISALSDVDQYALGNNTPTLVAWNTVVSNAGFVLDPSGYASVQLSGTYMIIYGLQLVNNDNVAHDVHSWLQVNGSAVVNSTSRFSLAARKSATQFTYNRAQATVMFNAQGGDEVRLYWATEKAATEAGVTGIFLEHEDAQVTPYARPVKPSAIGSITFVSRPQG